MQHLSISNGRFVELFPLKLNEMFREETASCVPPSLVQALLLVLGMRACTEAQVLSMRLIPEEVEITCPIILMANGAL